MNRSSDAALELAENNFDDYLTHDRNIAKALYFLAYALVMVLKEFLEEYKKHH